jgi:hypothetical protein
MRNDKDADGSAFRAALRGTGQTPANVPDIAGVEIPHETNKGEKAWRLIVKQNATCRPPFCASTAMSALTGRFRRHIRHQSPDGSRPSLIHVTPVADGTPTLCSRAIATAS